MVGTSQYELFYEARPRETFSEVLTAIERVGQLEQSSERTKTATARVRYGLQRVRLRIAVVPAESGSTIRVSGAGDDIWGAAARRATDKFVRALG